MIIQIHMIQNHSPANLNRDDLGAPKTCYFGGVLRSRISSQSLKRSIRMSDEFKELLGGIRTRRLAELIALKIDGSTATKKRAEKILSKCGISPDKTKSSKKDESEENDVDSSTKDTKMLVYTTCEAIDEMAALLTNDNSSDEELAKKFAELISSKVYVPDMALTGRMLEPSGATEIWKGSDKTVEASLQVAHAISTHQINPEVDYFVAADDIPGEDAGAGYLDEAMFVSSCFYKYFSINWEQLVKNLNGNKELALHTIGAFLRGAAVCNPTGKQNSFAAHNLPDGILVELRNTPVNYANAFAEPVSRESRRSIIEQSIAQLAQYAHDIKSGYGDPYASIWFSPNLRYKFSNGEVNRDVKSCKTLDELTELMVNELSEKLNLGISWDVAKKNVLDEKHRLDKILNDIRKSKSVV